MDSPRRLANTTRYHSFLGQMCSSLDTCMGPTKRCMAGAPKASVDAWSCGRLAGEGSGWRGLVLSRLVSVTPRTLTGGSWGIASRACMSQRIDPGRSRAARWVHEESGLLEFCSAAGSNPLKQVFC